MIEYKISDVIKKLSLIIIASLAIVGILLASQIMISKTQVADTNVEENIQIAKEDLSHNEKAITSTKTTSRSSTEIRNTAKNSENEVTTEQVNNNNEENVEKVTENSNEENEEKVTEKDNSEEKEENTTSKKESSESEKEDEEDDDKEENKNDTAKTVSISEVKISKSMDLTKRTGLSREDFIKLISRVKADTSGFFEDNAGEIYDLCEEYSINEIFFCGLISAESGWNIASNHRSTHNYISLMKNGKLISYSSVSEGLEVAAKKLHYNYLTPGGKFYHGKTLAGVKTCFCPSSTWVDLVYGRMKQIV